MPPKVARLVAAQKPEKKEDAEGKSESHKCVMCEASMASKQALQDHFRLHANGTIDMKGKYREPESDQNNRQTPIKSNLLPVNNVPSNLLPVKNVPCNLLPVKNVPSNLHPVKNVPSNLHPVKNVPNHRGTSKISCDVCVESFDTVTMAIQHKFRKHPNSNVKYFCGFCGKQYPLDICKINHIKSDHKTDRRTSKLYKCRDCTAEFFTVEAIKYHIRSSHQRVTALINPTATLGPSKKIKMNISGEASSVYYCHLCGQEYMVKFNLQKHLEANHSAKERSAPPESMIKCKLCDAIFYNKKAYESHNLLHSPEDLYIKSEEDRKLAVLRVDQDFDQSRVPSLLDKLLPVGRPRPLTPDKTQSANVKTSSGSSSMPIISSSSPTSTLTSGTGPGRNRAVVDSDSEDKSDTSIESEDEEQRSGSKEKAPFKKRRKVK